MAGQLAGTDFIYAPHAVYDRTPGVERCVYGAGDIVPMSDAIRYGLVQAPEPRPPAPAPTGRRGGARSRRPAEDRAKHPGADR
jgi:hypothetical protein